MDEWHLRKQERKKEYLKNYGLKSITCTACNGSGKYDNYRSPNCGLCDGTGKIKPNL